MKPWNLRLNIQNFLTCGLCLCMVIVNLFLLVKMNTLPASTSVYFVLVWLALAPVFVFITIYNLRKYQGLQDMFSGVLFAASIGSVILAVALNWIEALSVTNAAILIIMSMAVFTLLYACVQKAGRLGINLPHKSAIFSLALIGIIALASAFAVVYHTEDTSEISHTQNIFNEYFRLSQQLPDEVVSINLTTADHISVDMTKQQNANCDPSASITFTISNESLGSNAAVYFSSSTIDSWWVKNWEPPENGTYVFTLHFNYAAANYVWVGVTRTWSTIEPIPSEVATPLFAQFTPIVYALAIVSLATSLTVTILNVKESSRPKLKQTIDQ